MAIHWDKPTILYRAYSLDDELLYVGVTQNWLGRESNHRTQKPWWKEEVHFVTHERFDNRADALTEEKLVIREERPLYNVMYSEGCPVCRGSR